MDLKHAAAFVAGTIIVLWSYLSAIRAFMIPGSQHHLLGRVVFRVTQAIFVWFGRFRSPEGRQSFYTLFGPIGLLGIFALVMLLNWIGFALTFWAVAGRDLSKAGISSAVIDSGSALSTLGFADLSDLPRAVLSVFEALATTTISALLIGYLPMIFSAFLSTENAVSDLRAETGGAQCGAQVLVAIQRNPRGNDLWKGWSKWFGRVAKQRGGIVGSLFMHAPETDSSWISAAGSVLDAAALRESAVAGPPDPDVAYCLATGVTAFRNAVTFLGFRSGEQEQAYHAPGVTRDQFDDACRQLAAGGIALVPDLDSAWQTFTSIRATYIRQITTLAAIKGASLATLDCSPSPRTDPLALPVRRGKHLAEAITAGD